MEEIMEWLNNRLGQIIAGVTVAGTLAGFGYEGAQTINRIDNLESTTNDYITAVDSIADSMADIEKKMVVLDEQMKGLKIHDHDSVDLSGIKEDIAGLKATVDSLKNKDSNPLAN